MAILEVSGQIIVSTFYAFLPCFLASDIAEEGALPAVFLFLVYIITMPFFMFTPVERCFASIPLAFVKTFLRRLADGNIFIAVFNVIDRRLVFGWLRPAF